MRHDDPLVRSYSVTHPQGNIVLPTQQHWSQIIYATSKSMVARTEAASWTVPRERAICIEGGARIELATTTDTPVRCLYMHQSLAGIEGKTRVVHLATLTRELLLHTVETCPLDGRLEVHRALTTLLIDQFARLPTAPLHLPQPTDERARHLAELIDADPASQLSDLIPAVPASRRTLERLFLTQTRLSPAGWQRRSRILKSVSLMTNDGYNVTRAATAVGYSTPSAFVVAFRSELGTTPSSFTT